MLFFKKVFTTICTVLLIIVPLLLQGQAWPPMDTADSLDLVTIYYYTGGNNWTNKTNWLTGPVSTWQGVTLVISENGVGDYIYKVEQLNLFNNNLTGQLPEFGLSRATVLDFGFNHLVGSMPSMSTSYNIQTLYLDGNNLNSFGSFSWPFSLENLYVNNNRFTGSVPAFYAPNLNTFYAQNNAFTEILFDPNLNYISYCNIDDNNLLFDDLLPYASASTFTSLDYTPQAPAFDTKTVYLYEDTYYYISSYIPGSGNSYAWFKDGTSLSNTGSGYSIGPIVSSDEGSYSTQITNTNVPNLTLNGIDTKIIVVPNSIVMPSMFTFPDYDDTYYVEVNEVWEDQDRFVQTGTVVIPNGSTLTINDITLYICNLNFFFIVQAGGTLNADGAVFKPCDDENTWGGIQVFEGGDVAFVNNSECHNARVGLDVKGNIPVQVTNSAFYNCRVGVRVQDADDDSGAANRLIQNTTFETNNDVPEFVDAAGNVTNQLIAVDIGNSYFGDPALDLGGVNGCFFTNLAFFSTSFCMQPCGISADSSAINSRQNQFNEMYCAIDMKQPRGTSVSDGDQIVNTGMQACYTELCQISISENNDGGTVFIQNDMVEGGWDETGMAGAKIMLGDTVSKGICVDNSQNVHIVNNVLNRQHYNILMNATNNNVRVVGNDIDGGLVGTFCANTTNGFIYAKNKSKDILCAVGFRLDDSYVGSLENQLFEQTLFTLNMVTNRAGDTGGHPTYTMRFFSCNPTAPTDSCVSSFYNNVTPPVIVANFMGDDPSDISDIAMEIIDSTSWYRWVAQLNAYNPNLHPKTDSMTVVNIIATNPDLDGLLRTINGALQTTQSTMVTETNKSYKTTAIFKQKSTLIKKK